MPAVPNILLVEDHEIVAQTVLHFLRVQDNMTVYPVARTAEAALAQLPDLAVDLVLVDVSLPAMSGIELVALIAQLYPDVRCLMLSGHDELSYVKRALEAGAWGFVSKGNPQTLLDGIRAALRGEIYVDGDLDLPQP